MPGGTGGPHRIQGVGFWAQQGFYGVQQIDYGPFIFRPSLKGLPEQPPPPNAFQSWTVNPSFALQHTIPPTTNAVFRGVWKSVPEQPFRPEFTWIEAGNALTAPAGFIVRQSDWPNPIAPW